MRGRAFQSRAFAPWALAGGSAVATVRTGRTITGQIYRSAAQAGQANESGTIKGQDYQSGSRAGAVE